MGSWLAANVLIMVVAIGHYQSSTKSLPNRRGRLTMVALIDAQTNT
jgi:hypothetical protein